MYLCNITILIGLWMKAKEKDYEIPPYLSHRLPWDFRVALEDQRLNWIESGCTKFRLCYLTYFELFSFSYYYLETFFQTLKGEKEQSRRAKIQEIVSAIRTAIDEEFVLSLCGCSVMTIVESVINPNFCQSFQRINVRFNSGKLSCWLSTLRGNTALGRVQVSDLDILNELLTVSNFRPIVVTDNEELLQCLQQESRYPTFSINSQENLGQEIEDVIVAEGIDLILVACSNPCEEVIWIVNNQNYLEGESIPVILFAAGSFIHRASGLLPPSPSFLSKIGLEGLLCSFLCPSLCPAYQKAIWEFWLILMFRNPSQLFEGL